MTWPQFWLILHVLAVVIAFGPTFAFGLIAGMGQKNPQHARFAAEVSHLIETRLVLPVAVAVFVFGAVLIFVRDYDLLKSEWLLISIVLYIVAMAFSALVQGRWSKRMLAALEALPPGPPPEGAGPPGEIAELGKRLQMGGMFLSLIFVAILVLMIWRPGSAFTV